MRTPTEYPTCIGCKHFRFSCGSTHYSERTPGSDAVWECRKMVWVTTVDSEIPNLLLAAKDCEHFDPKGEGDTNG